MLQNDYLVVKIGVDSAENGPSKVVRSEISAARPGCVDGQRLPLRITSGTAVCTRPMRKMLLRRGT